MSDNDLNAFNRLQGERAEAQRSEAYETIRIQRMEWEDKTLAELTRVVAARRFTTDERKQRLAYTQAQIADLDAQIHDLWDEIFEGLEDEVDGVASREWE